MLVPTVTTGLSHPSNGEPFKLKYHVAADTEMRRHRVGGTAW